MPTIFLVPTQSVGTRKIGGRTVVMPTIFLVPTQPTATRKIGGRTVVMPTIKLAFTSDLHLPITSRAAIDCLALEVAAFEPDAVVVAGDVAESLDDLAMCLGLLRQHITAPILVLPGNHDLWARGFPSRSKWQYRLQEIVEEAGCRWHEGRAWTHNGFAVAGTIAWYDYSAKDPAITRSEER